MQIQQAIPIVAAFDLKAWRTSQLAQLKQRDEYTALATRQRRIVDHIIRRYLHPIDGAFPKHMTLAAKFEVSEKTIDRDMKVIRGARIFVSEPRYRGAGTCGGRTSNRLRINPLMLSLPATDSDMNVPQPVPELVPQPVPAEGSNQVEGLSAVGGKDQVEGSRHLEEIELDGNVGVAGRYAPLPTELERKGLLPTTEEVLPSRASPGARDALRPEIDGRSLGEKLQADALRLMLRNEGNPPLERIRWWRALDELLGPLPAAWGPG